MEKPAELVFILSPGIGHLVSTLEIAKFLLSLYDQLLITIFIMKFPAISKGTNAYVESFADSFSPISQRMKFINLPHVNMDHMEGNVRNSLIDFVESQQPHVKDAITKLSESKTRLAGFVVDMLCVAMIEVADQFGVPSYVFFTSSAGTLWLINVPPPSACL